MHPEAGKDARCAQSAGITLLEKQNRNSPMLFTDCKTMFEDSVDEAVVPLMDFTSHSFYLRTSKDNFVTQ